ncbi:hypothetical protein FACS189493_4780 [Spirochaetia bacterium]|nr:hypothetical protein FACS189493_4780 [Spirochaetia bacterium]
MDDRKKTIRELEDQKRRDEASIDTVLEKLGAALLPRIQDDSAADVAEYHHLLNEIREAEALIEAAQNDIAQLKSLEEDIQKKEQSSAGQSKELTARYTRMGEYILNEDDFEPFTQPYREQLEVLVPKIKSLEDRLGVLDDRGDANVFTWIGKNAKGMVLRSFLGKNQSNLQRIYAAAGEKFVLATPYDAVANAGAREILDDIEAARQVVRELGTELSGLREERRRITESFSAEGGPLKKIQVLERRIDNSREQLRAVYLRHGKQAEERAGDADAAGVSLFNEADRELLGQIAAFRDAIGNLEGHIIKLQASLDIDEERTKIARMEKSIAEHRQRIAAGEGAIAGLSHSIEEANNRLKELSKLL